VPEIIDPVFTKTSPKRSFSMTENERFGLDFANTGSINSGTGFSMSGVMCLSDVSNNFMVETDIKALFNCIYCILLILKTVSLS